MKTYSKLIVELTKKATTIKWSKPKSINSGHKGEYIVKSEDGRFVIYRQATYGGGFSFALIDKKNRDNTWNNLPSLKDAKDTALDYI